MKTNRVFLGTVAFLFAFVSAFAFKASPLVEDPSYLDDGECIRVTVSECQGGTKDCVKFVNSTIGNQTIYNFTSTSSCTLLKMP